MSKTRTAAFRSESLLLRILAASALIVGMVVSGVYIDLDWQVWAETLAHRFQDAGLWGPIGLIALMIGAVMLVPIPTIPITVSAGVAYGPVAGAGIAMAGALTGALLSFWIARFAGRDLVGRLAGGHVSLCPRCSDRLLFWVVLAARLIPAVSFGLVSYGAGLTAMSARAFGLATAIGMIPMTWIYVSLGSAVRVHTGWTVAIGIGFVLVMLFLAPAMERLAPRRIKAMLSHMHSPEGSEVESSDRGRETAHDDVAEP